MQMFNNSKTVKLILFAMTMLCLVNVAAQETKPKSVTEGYMQILRQADQRQQETLKKTKESLGANSVEYDPSGLILKSYQAEILKADKLVAGGGVFDREKYLLARATIDAVRKQVSEDFLRRSKQRSEARLQASKRDAAKSNEQYERMLADSLKKHDSAKSNANEKYRHDIARIELDYKLKSNSGKIGVVIWNLPTEPSLHDRSTGAVKISLLRDDTLVWAKRSMGLNRRDVKTPIRLPNMLFDTVQIEAIRWNGNGAGLAEIQVFVGNENVALGRPCKVSSIETLPIHLDDKNAATDGVLAPTKLGEGYWIPEPETKATVTIDLLGKPDEEVLKAAKALKR